MEYGSDFSEPNPTVTGIPGYLEPYYPNKPMQQYGFSELRLLLSIKEWPVSFYRFAEFDCTEMSAFLERELELNGWNTDLVIGRIHDVAHGWLLVEVYPNWWMPVEPTIPGIPLNDLKPYYSYEMRYKNIYEAHARAPTQFDWWTLLE